MPERSELLPALSDYRWLRWFAFAALYVAQGLPYGLFLVAIPTWLAHICREPTWKGPISVERACGVLSW